MDESGRSGAGAVLDELSSGRTGLPLSPAATWAVHPCLRPFLVCGYTGWERPPERASQFLLPASVAVHVVLTVEDSPVRPPEFMQGVHSTYRVIDSGCAPQYIEVALLPLGAFQLLGVPMDHLSGRLVDLRDVLGSDARRLGEIVREASTWPARFDAIDRFLLARLETAPVVSPEVETAWQRMAEVGGMVSIRAISREVGWSHKHLITRFKNQVGLCPKLAARVIRFQRVVGRLGNEPRPGWGRLAEEYGYADQAHLIRDFGEFVGTSPTAFLAASNRAESP